MNTFVVVDGISYPGILHLGERVYEGTCEFPIPAFHGYLQVNLPDGHYVHVERWGFEGDVVTEVELREAITPAIKARLEKELIICLP